VISYSALRAHGFDGGGAAGGDEAGYDRGEDSRSATEVKMAVFAPMPRAKVSRTVRVRPGFFHNARAE
jgi:hypothetical protein